MRLFYLFVLSLVVVSCKTPALENEANKVLYFDMKALIAKQVSSLSAIETKVQKFIRHDKKRENHSLTVGNWEQELHIFTEANLNRPIFKDLYTETDSVAQDIKYHIFTAKNNRLEVRSLRLAYYKDRLQSLDAHLLITNVLYHSEKQLRLTFSPTEILSGYGVKGKFSMVYGAKHDYEIDAVVK
ncbi:MAG: hypothetical protein EAZ95_11935 [Bacteroidetes bacterium]|nr:MAG: hypothetical protein EAZ95_11935 [Bacteroidota bacterium]